jgi:hypothetical protein
MRNATKSMMKLSCEARGPIISKITNFRATYERMDFLFSISYGKKLHIELNKKSYHNNLSRKQKSLIIALKIKNCDDDHDLAAESFLHNIGSSRYFVLCSNPSGMCQNNYYQNSQIAPHSCNFTIQNLPHINDPNATRLKAILTPKKYLTNYSSIIFDRKKVHSTIIINRESRTQKYDVLRAIPELIGLISIGMINEVKSISSDEIYTSDKWQINKIGYSWPQSDIAPKSKMKLLAYHLVGLIPQERIFGLASRLYCLFYDYLWDRI